MDSGRGSTPVGKAAAENSTPNAISPEGSDSGYGSTGNTTDGSMTDHSQVFADGVALPSRKFYEPKVKKLRPFDKEIPQLVQHRFHDLHELFERPLCDYLIRAKVHPNPISVKLKVLGESEATAKPWIVVLCNKTASKKIQQFFNQQHIKAEYKPSNPDSTLPSFELFVCNRPPRPMAGTEIYGNPDERATMCGRVIKIGEAHQSRSATLGGVIKYVLSEPIFPLLDQTLRLEACLGRLYSQNVFQDSIAPIKHAILIMNLQPRVIEHTGAVMLYGMTAGHILTQQPPGQDNIDPVDICDDKDEEDEGFYSGEEEHEQEYELDVSFEDDEEVQTLTNAGDKSGRLWPRIGHAYATSNEGTRKGHDLDWALIEFDRPVDCRPNLLVSFDHEEQAAKIRPLKENGKFTEDGSHRPVLLLSGTGGVKSGTLSTSLSFLMMGPAKAFTKTYTLVMPHGSVLNAGDCGSWVVDPSTCEVYGHVVASDAMGDTYVVPLGATLRDMEEKLEAAVSLPTEADIKTWLAQRAKAAAEDVTVPARSNKKKVAFNHSKTDRAESPKDLVELTKGPWSQASSSSTSSATQTSTTVVDYCNLCNERFEGTSQNVKSNLLHHVQTSPRHKKDATIGIENSVSQDAKDARDGRSKKSSAKHSKDVQQKTTDSTAMQQPSPVPWSIRSAYSSLRNRSKSDSPQKDGDKGNSVGSSKKKPAGSASAKKPAAAALPTSIAKDLKNTTKESKSKKDLASPPLGKRLPAPSSAPVGRISKDLHPGTPATPVVPDHQLSPPINTPLPPRFRQGAKLATPPPPRPVSQFVHGHESFPGSNLDPHHLSHNSSPGPVSYEGYTFTKCYPKRIGQKATWAVARMTPMPVSQEDLKDQVKRNRNKHVSALDDYDEKMKGFKRKQVENLIRERTKIDGDYGYEYVLASIKLDSRQIKRNLTETVSMQVILKRQLIAGFLHEPLTGSSMDLHVKLPSQVMDLTSEDTPGKAREFSGGSQDVGHEGAMVSFAGRPEPGASLVDPWYGQPFGHGVRNLDERLPSFPVVPQPSLFHSPFDYLKSSGQGMGQSLHFHSVPLNHPTYDTQAFIEISDKSKQEKKRAPKISHAKVETRKKRDHLSDSPSLSDLSPDLDSDGSWTKTDATPDTLLSGESRQNSKETQFDKASIGSSYDKDSLEPRPYAHEKARPVYRHHRKEEDRHSSLSPARRSSDDLGLNPEHHGGRTISPRPSYRPSHGHHGYHEVEPGIGFPADRTSWGRRSSVSPERPSHRRTSSYNLNRPLIHNSRALVPTYRRPIAYRETSRDFSRPVDVYDHRAELAREREGWERDRLHFERDEAEAEARARALEMEREERRFKEHEARMEMEREERRFKEQEARMEMMREIDRRERAIIERRRLRRGTTFDDGYMP